MGKLFKISQKSLNLPAGYDPLCPQCEDSSEDGDDDDEEDEGVDLDEVFRVIPREEDLVPVPVLAPGMVYQLVLIEDLAENEEGEDEEIEEGLAIEIVALDPAPAYTE